MVSIDDEWRLIIVHQRPIAASSYKAKKRIELTEGCPLEVWEFAEKISQNLPPPDFIYALDICRCGYELRLLEINPFSGADLYACDREAIVEAVEMESMLDRLEIVKCYPNKK